MAMRAQDHPHGQVLLARVGEELDVGAAAVVAHHGEARYLVLGAVQSDDRDEAPVHLVRLTGPGHEALPAAPLWRDRPSPCGDQVHVGGYVDLDAREAATISLADQPLVDHLRVGDALPEQVVHKAGVSGEHGGAGLPAGVAMREHPEAVALDGPGPRPRQPGPATEVGQVARLRVEPLARLGRHLLQCLVHDLL